MTDSHNGHSLDRSFRLISVSFKEASLDSPSFRASINHLDSQLSNLTKWANALSGAMYKLPRKVNELRLVINSFTEHLLPQFTDEGLIDQETTIPLLESLSKSHTQLFDVCLDVLSINPNTIRELIATVNGLSQKYHGYKRTYDVTREKYDQYFEVYMSNSKLKQPDIAIEDALQLFKTKKEYLHASLDLVTAFNEISSAIDAMFMDLGSRLWVNTVKKGAVISLSDMFPDTFEIIKRTQGWASAFDKAMKSFIPDVLQARQQVEKTTIELFEPSTDPRDYDASLINAHSLGEIDEPSYEKHGYLMMKTWRKNSNKPIWVRRWAFIKGGVFGMLVLSPSQSFVQETDKIGVLLISLRYAAQETRRFCFELRTSDQVITFQAESLLEMKSWFKVFDNEKARILESDSDSPSAKVASTRFPPSVTEFASTVDTLVDKQMTNTRLKDENGNIIASSNLSSKIKSNEQYFQKYLYHQIPSFKPPLITSNTKTAIIAYSFAAASSVPTALTANTWGSVNWGLYYLHKNLSSTDVSYDQSFPEINDAVDGSTTREVYPLNYPHAMVSLDVEMRALFEMEIDVGEICLLSFSCIWSPNRNQQLFSRVFVTNKSLLLCNQAFGFRSLFKSDFTRLVDVESPPLEDHDELKIHFVDDFITGKVYLEKGELIKRKLKFLIDDKNKDQPVSVEAVIDALNKIDREFQAEEKARLSAISRPKTAMQHSDSISKSSQLEKVPVYDEHFSELPFMIKKRYDVPAKAIFHVLVGEFSTVLQSEKVAPVGFVNKVYRKLPDGRLRNSFYCVQPNSGPPETKKYKVDVTIEKMVEDQYYSISNVRSFFTFYGSTFSGHVQVFIQAENSGACVVKYNCEFKFKTLKPTNFVNRILLRALQVNEVRELEERVCHSTKGLGTSGQIGRAIFLYGKVPQGTVPEEDLRPTYCKLGFRFVFYKFIFEPGLYCMSTLVRFIRVLMDALFGYVKEITAQRLLLALLAVSVLINILVTSRMTYSYWSASQTHRRANQMFNSEPYMLQRAVYLKDTQALMSPKAPNVTSAEASPRCLPAFEKVSFVRNFEAPINWDDEYFDADTKDVAIGLKKMFQEVGVKRHKLLLDFNMLNHMEEEIAKGEYRNWLVSEVRKCAMARSKNLAEVVLASGDDDLEQIAEGLNNLSLYCESCADELQRLSLV